MAPPETADVPPGVPAAAESAERPKPAVAAAPARRGSGWSLPCRLVPVLAVLGLAVIAALLLADPLVLAWHFVPRNYNEGWMALQTARALGGPDLAAAGLADGRLYDTAGRFIATDYPPLFFYVIGLFRAWTPDLVFAGRLAATVGFAGLILGVGVAALVATRDLLCAVLAALFLTLVMTTFFHEYVAMADPQIFAHAVALPALILVLAGATGRAGLFVTALLLVLAGFIKHNLFALPLAITLYLMIYHRPMLRWWLAYAAGLLAAGFALCLAVFGFGLIDGLLTPRVFSLQRLGRESTRYLVMLQLPIAFWLLSLLAGRLDRKDGLIALYIGLSAAFGIVFMGGDGTSFNAFFDLAIGLALALALGLKRLEHRLAAIFGNRTTTRAVLALAAVAVCGGALIAAPAGVYRLVRDVTMMPGWVAQTQDDVAYLRAQPGPVLCDSLDLCYWAGKGFEVDVYNAAQLTALGDLDAEALFGRVRQGAFSVIQLPRLTPQAGDNAFLRGLIEVTQAHYRVTRHNHDGVFLEYRGREAGRP